MRTRLIIFSLLACVVCGVGAAIAFAAGSGASSAGSGAAVLTSTTYGNAVPASPQGMPSQAAANQAEATATPPIGEGDNSGVTVLTQTTYTGATPSSPQGMPSQAAANQARNDAPTTSSSSTSGSGGAQ